MNIIENLWNFFAQEVIYLHNFALSIISLSSNWPQGPRHMTHLCQPTMTGHVWRP